MTSSSLVSTSAIWGRNDPSFIAAGAEAFKRDLPDAEIHLLDAGHFALDEKNDDIASLILEFLAKHSLPQRAGTPLPS
jgi:pimeloyl-ACP methyl ester carboxylesterase